MTEIVTPPATLVQNSYEFDKLRHEPVVAAFVTR